MPTNTIWTIKPNHVHGPNPNKNELVGCRVAIVNDDEGSHYQFQYPNGSVTSPGEDLPPLPYTFSSFTSSLFGSQEETWTITLISLEWGKSHNNAHGTFDTGSTAGHSITGGETDTWTAQAGVGDDPEEEEKAAYATPKS